jgi:hypothetical protein
MSFLLCRFHSEGREGVGAGRVGDGAGDEERDNEGERDGEREPWAPSSQ